MERQVHTGKIEHRFLTLQMDSLPVEPQGKPKNLKRVAYPFSRGSSRPRNQTRASCIADGFFTTSATWEAHRRGTTHPLYDSCAWFMRSW